MPKSVIRLATIAPETGTRYTTWDIGEANIATDLGQFILDRAAEMENSAPVNFEVATYTQVN